MKGLGLRKLGLGQPRGPLLPGCAGAGRDECFWGYSRNARREGEIVCAGGGQRPLPRLLFSLSSREDTGGHTSVVYVQVGQGFEIAQAERGLRLLGFSLLDPSSEFAGSARLCECSTYQRQLRRCQNRSMRRPSWTHHIRRLRSVLSLSHSL